MNRRQFLQSVTAASAIAWGRRGWGANGGTSDPGTLPRPTPRAGPVAGHGARDVLPFRSSDLQARMGLAKLAGQADARDVQPGQAGHRPVDGGGQGHGGPIRGPGRQALQRFPPVAERPLSLRRQAVPLARRQGRRRAGLRGLVPQVRHPARPLCFRLGQRVPGGGQSRSGQPGQRRGPGGPGPLREDLRADADGALEPLRRSVRNLVRRRGDAGREGRPGPACRSTRSTSRKAIVFQGPAASIRWIGNEQGVAAYPCWATVPHRQDYNGPGDPNGRHWLPGECDVPVRGQEWFWTPDGDKSLLPGRATDGHVLSFGGPQLQSVAQRQSEPGGPGPGGGFPAVRRVWQGDSQSGSTRLWPGPRARALWWN